MKKYLSLILLVAVILFFGANKVVLAENNAGSDNANANANIGVNNTNANNTAQNLTLRIKGFGNRVMQIGKKVEKIVAQLIRHQERVAGFIANLEAAGKDVTIANEKLALSKSSLVSAQSSFQAAKDIVTNIDLTQQIGNKEYIKGIKDSFKTKMEEAKKFLKESRIYLKDAIKEIKNLRNPENPADDNEDDNEAAE